MSDLAKAAYDAYSKEVGGTTFDGRPLPAFEELGERQQRGWEAAVMVGVDSTQAQIDELMLEYCPDEMTEEQKQRWADCQGPASEEEQAAFDKISPRNQEKIKIRVFASLEGDIERVYEFPYTDDEDEIEEYFVLADEKMLEEDLTKEELTDCIGFDVYHTEVIDDEDDDLPW